MHHVWQDYVIAAGSIFFSVALIPSIVGKDKPALWTGVITTTVLAVLIFTYLSLNLTFATFAVALNCLAWIILTIQEYRRIKK